MPSSEIVTTLKKVVVGATFTQVVIALMNGMTNIPGQIQEAFDAFLKRKGVGQDYIAIARHSMGGRKCTTMDSRAEERLFFAEEGGYGSNPGWLIVTEDNAMFVELTSATSGSKLTAEREDSGHTWTVSLEVPVGADGQPYQGMYWQSFHNVFEVVSLSPPKEEPVVEAPTASC